jgi:hypothetical protein
MLGQLWGTPSRIGKKLEDVEKTLRDDMNVKKNVKKMSSSDGKMLKDVEQHQINIEHHHEDVKQCQ